MSPSAPRTREAPARWRALAENLLVALLYYVAGTLASRLAHPPGYPAAVWPSSGIALAAVLLAGPRVWPGIAAGSLLASLQASVDAGSAATTSTALAVAAVLAVGAVVQALVGGFCVRRLAGFPHTFSNEIDVLRFFVLGGAVSSLIRPTIGVASLALSGSIASDEVFLTWASWWIGDTIGTTLLAPLALLWCSRALSVRRGRRISVTAPLFLTLGLTIVLYGQVRARDREWTEQAVERRAVEISHRLQRALRSDPDPGHAAADTAAFEGLAAELWEIPGDGPARPVWSFPDGGRTPDGEPADGATGRVHALRFPSPADGREFELRLWRSTEGAVGPHSVRAWSVLAGGLLATGLLGALLILLTGRTDAVEGLVARRTAEIEKVNAHLRHQVSERARAEHRARASEFRLATAQQIAHLGSFELDLATRSVFWSDELYRIHGDVPGEFAIDYDSFLGRVHIEDREAFERAIGQSIRDLRPFRLRYRIVRGDGSVRILDGRGEVVTESTGIPVRLQGTGQDVTELALAEKELAHRTEELERSNAELERFAYVASHDLQEPLRAVTSNVQILQEDYQGRLGPEADVSIRLAVEGAKRMHDLINGYLAYSRVQHGSAPRQPTSSAAALRQAVQALRDEIARGRVEIAHGTLPIVAADPEQLVELFRNLIANALKFRRDETPRIHVSATRADRTWIFAVRDNGIGIDAEHTGRIFRLFQRLHTPDRYPGTGIGLAICKRIVDRHGGRIWVESMPGMGSVFYFTLSADAETPAWPHQEALPVAVAHAPVDGLENRG